MILFKKADDLAKYVEKQKQNGTAVGFVPTMGALHEGHISLIQQSVQTCNITVSSIFINPTQFNDKKDFEKYPVTIGDDILLLEKAGCDILFLPSVDEMYPGGTNLRDKYELGEIETLLEGKYRPGHFQGVAQVVHRLLEIVQPGKLFIGQKDFQQCLVIRKLVSILKLPTQVVIEPTLREPTGLAMSSRNKRLTTTQRQQAQAIYQALISIKRNFKTTPRVDLITKASRELLDAGFNKIDYVEIADAETLMPADNLHHATNLVALVAAFIGEVRLIDNLILTE